MIGRTLAHYRIVSRLGAGGMGEVYLAEDRRLGRRIALKVLPEKVAADPERLRRFEREARTLAALDHPNIVTVHSVEEAEGIRFLTMAHVEGKTLDRAIPADGMRVADLLGYATAIADALCAAHAAGIVHRDLKPSNVMVDERGRLRVLDFGLAKTTAEASSGAIGELPTVTVTSDGALVGTVPYMSPEQVEGRAADERSDLFSFGVLLHEMASGARPFGGDSSMAVAAAILKEPPPDIRGIHPDLPERFVALVERCLEKDPERRFQSAHELLDELTGIQRDVDSMAFAATTVERSRLPARRSGVRWGLSAASVAVVIVAALLGFDVGGLRRMLPTMGGVSPIRSLAVLPLRDLSGDPEQEYFADGMTAAMIADLSKIRALEVISRASSMRYKRSEKPLPEIARELGVEAVLAGTVAHEAGYVRITAELVDASSDRNLWAESYEREWSSVLALQGEIARAIAAEIEIQLTPQEETRLTARAQVDPESYQDYLRGLYHLNQGTREGNERGLRYLLQAVERDPASASANAALGLGYMIAAHGPAPPSNALEHAQAAVRRALELDESNAAAHAALAMIREYETWEWDGALEEFERALELDPSLAETRAHYSFHFALRGRIEEALEEMRVALRIDPLTPLWHAWYGWQLNSLERFDEAEAAARAALELDPDFGVGLFVLGNALAGQGDWDDALEAHRRAAEVSMTWRTAPAITLALRGDTEQARALADEIGATAGLWDTYFLAQIYSILGEIETALGWLEQAFAEPHHTYAPWIEVEQYFGPLRNDPRYLALLDRLNLPPEGLRPRS